MPSMPLARKASVGLPVASSAVDQRRRGARPGPTRSRPTCAAPGSTITAVVARPRAQVGQDRPLEHLLHLVGHAGHRVDDLVADRADQPGRGARRCGMTVAPDGHVGLAQVVRRPCAGLGARTSRGCARRSSSSRTSSTPITSAIASRVMSSWVGPRPPHTITASAAVEREPQRRHDAGQVVADLGLESASRCRRARAAHRSRTSWCRRSGRAAARCRRRRPRSACRTHRELAVAPTVGRRLAAGTARP